MHEWEQKLRQQASGRREATTVGKNEAETGGCKDTATRASKEVSAMPATGDVTQGEEGVAQEGAVEGCEDSDEEDWAILREMGKHLHLSEAG